MRNADHYRARTERLAVTMFTGAVLFDMIVRPGIESIIRTRREPPILPGLPRICGRCGNQWRGNMSDFCPRCGRDWEGKRAGR